MKKKQQNGVTQSQTFNRTHDTLTLLSRRQVIKSLHPFLLLLLYITYSAGLFRRGAHFLRDDENSRKKTAAITIHFKRVIYF